MWLMPIILNKHHANYKVDVAIANYVAIANNVPIANHVADTIQSLNHGPTETRIDGMANIQQPPEQIALPPY